VGDVLSSRVCQRSVWWIVTNKPTNWLQCAARSSEMLNTSHLAGVSYERLALSLSPDTVSRVRRERNKSGKDRLLRKWLQLWFDFDSTAIRLLIKGHWGHSDVNTSRWPASRSHADLFIMPRPIRAEALSDAFVWRLTSVVCRVHRE